MDILQYLNTTWDFILLQWFNDVYSADISHTCDNVLTLLSDTYGCNVSGCKSYFNFLTWPKLNSKWTCSEFNFFVEFEDVAYVFLKMTEIVIPELHEMRISHIVSIGSEQLVSLNPESRYNTL